MEKFGFSLQKARVINYDSNDRSIVEYVLEREPSLKLCIECGCCSAACTTGNFTDFSLREMHILLKRGENNEVRNKIKKCMLCGKCILVCPRGVNTRNVVFLAKQAFQKYSAHAV
ncbi:MAG: 4Fe-4S dicluster domain-containing protein [Bacteroidales bacterium]|mgnify:FL=1|jgi:heterodisulfide reductase subunit C|nr:4Fe-4S dicluster domain-containing protein [Bacteroidales bacterium]